MTAATIMWKHAVTTQFQDYVNALSIVWENEVTTQGQGYVAARVG